MEKILDWVQDWFTNQCDGMWEHGYGVRVNMISEPGWHVRIELRNTPWAEKKTELVREKLPTGEIVYYEVKNGYFEAKGGISTLEILLNIFKKWIEKNLN